MKSIDNRKNQNNPFTKKKWTKKTLFKIQFITFIFFDFCHQRLTQFTENHDEHSEIDPDQNRKQDPICPKHLLPIPRDQ